MQHLLFLLFLKSQLQGFYNILFCQIMGLCLLLGMGGGRGDSDTAESGQQGHYHDV